jgi:hypothetical protein
MAKYSENDLKSSVGKHGPAGKQCYNTIGDQEMVQYLLNAIPESYGGSDGKLKSSPRWGVVSDELYKAILNFQTVHATDEGLFVDGHVDPHDLTVRALLKYAYRIIHGDSQLASDLFSSFPIRAVPVDVLPTSGIKVTDQWEFTVSAGFAGTGVSLPNDVWLPLPPRGRVWPNRATKIMVSRSINKDGKKEYNVLLAPPGSDAALKWAEKKIAGQGPSRAASAGLWMLPKTVQAGAGSVLGVLIPTNAGPEKVWTLETTEAGSRIQVNGVTSF